MPENAQINSLQSELNTDDDIKMTGRYMEPNIDIRQGSDQDVPFFYTPSHLVNYKVVSQLFQLIFLSSSYN